MASGTTEPDWKIKQREQDALIGKEETAVKTRVEEMLKPILEGADNKVTSQGDDEGLNQQLQLQGELSEKIRQATKMLEEGLVERDSQVRLLLLAAFLLGALTFIRPTRDGEI